MVSRRQRLGPETPIPCRRSNSSTNTTGSTVPSRFPLKPPFHHTTKLRVLMDSPALGKAELVVGECASWALSKGGRRKLLRSKAKKTAQRTARAPCAASLAASHVHSSRAAPAAGTPLAHTRLQGMLTGAPVLCIWGVILDLTCR